MIFLQYMICLLYTSLSFVSLLTFDREPTLKSKIGPIDSQ